MNKKIEKEVSKILTDLEYERLKERISKVDGVVPGHSVKELTVMYDNPNPELTFYSKSVDGRLRIRTSEAGKKDLLPENSTDTEVSMITWKQRIPKYKNAKEEINREYEIEVNIESKEMRSMIMILENVLHCPRISSYERNRETVYIDNVEIASDTFPYGHVVELELKDSDDENELMRVMHLLELDKCKTSTLSCDDMYKKLCTLNGINAKTDILFNDDTMPSLNKALENDWL